MHTSTRSKSSAAKKKSSKKTPMSDTRRAIQPVACVLRPTATLLTSAAAAAQLLWTGTAALTGAGSLTDTLRHGPLSRAVVALGAHHVLTAVVIALVFSGAAVLVLDQDATDDLAQAPAPHLHIPRSAARRLAQRLRRLTRR